MEKGIEMEENQLEWKSEPPIETGWYWVNFKIGLINFPVIVKYPLDGKEENMDLANLWYGPLPIPELP